MLHGLGVRIKQVNTELIYIKQLECASHIVSRYTLVFAVIITAIIILPSIIFHSVRSILFF